MINNKISFAKRISKFQCLKQAYGDDPKFVGRHVEANSVDPDQTAPRGTDSSGFSLFAVPAAFFSGIISW